MKKITLIRFTLLCILTFRFAIAVVNAQTNVQISGKVLDTNGNYIPNAVVQVVETKQIVVTNENGEFYIKVAAGKYQLTVKAKGFAENIVSANVGESTEIILKPKAVAEVVSVTSSYLAGTSEAIDQTAGSIQTVDKTELEKSRVVNFSEALRKVSGVNVRDEEGFGLRPNIGIRGTNPTRSTKVLLLEDGIPLAFAPYGDNASYYHPPIERFESIEVQKGSGQVEFGPVTVAGLVNYITPNPPEKTSFSFKLQGGNRNFFNGNAQFGGTFGKTGILLNYNRKQGDGARENTNSKLNDFSAKIVQTINSKNILTLKGSHFTENSNVTYSGLTEAEFAANARQNPFKNDFFNGYRTGLSATHTAVFNPKTSLTTNFYGSYFSRDWWRQSSNSAQRPNRLNVDSDCRSMADLNTTCGNEGRLRDYLVIGFEPKFSLDYDLSKVRGHLQTGFRVHFEEQKRRQLTGDLPTSRDGVLAERNLRENLASSVFFLNRLNFGKVGVSFGARYEHIEVSRQNLLGTGAFGKTTVSQFIPGVGITFNAFKNTTIFAGIHRGFAPPRAEDIITNAGGILELDSELSWNYEVGIRSRIGKGINFDATFFRNDYENQIVPASVAGGIGSAFTNGGKTLQQGFEATARIDSSNIFNTNYNFYLNTSYTNLLTAEFRGNRFSSISGFTTVSVNGNRLPYVPKNTLTSSFGYAYKNFDSFIENNYIARQWTDDLNTTNPIANGQRGAIGSQIYWNATANYKVEKLKSVFFITTKNLANRLFIVDRTRGILPSSPRLIQAGIKVNF